ncbi:hypothetical protein GCM10009661_78320 [Catellatospora chokoriensis]|uniref:Uncharacterized protein n=2 Tax=Catellatospora TaxID=53365 RepID=A0A8J3P0V2_9ACTN|nr:hypothetical protein Cch02nite_66210 [Catellatospora chokoriensis]GIF99853.1 hypothetical protein Cci01nite_49470 [Catellatospora citrea]
MTDSEVKRRRATRISNTAHDDDELDPKAHRRPGKSLVPYNTAAAQALPESPQDGTVITAA